MSIKFKIRTDLAVEVKESFPGFGGEIEGVSLDEIYLKKEDIKVTKVEILNEHGAELMHKPIGSYITLEAPKMSESDEGYHQEISKVLSKYVQELLPKKEQLKILVAGLGNADATPDSLGPRVIQNLQMTRHLFLLYGDKAEKEWNLTNISGIIPGVMAQTGMESVEIIKGVTEQTKPDVIVAIDALAAMNIGRLGTTIQLSDTGIQPGSGVGNHRNSLTQDSLGVPVIALGVPTVVGTVTIVQNTIDTMVKVLMNNSATKTTGEFIEKSTPEEQYQLIQELLEKQFGPVYVTPKDIDETVKRISYTISEGLHLAFQTK
ncbi:germination protease [Clostridia bacterium]|nr:germination protease [Clostridia bacterium]